MNLVLDCLQSQNNATFFKDFVFDFENKILYTAYGFLEYTIFSFTQQILFTMVT